MEFSQRNPFSALSELDRRFRTLSAGLPMVEEVHEVWRGIGFELAGTRLLAPLDEVGEILPVPSLTRVPLTKPWVLGLANVRGNLLPVMDLQGFLTGRDARPTAASRVLSVHHEDFRTGLLVDRVTGLQQLDVEARLTGIDGVAGWLAAYLDGGYLVAGESWPLFDFSRLASRQEFMQAAA